jgi:hypothetical protein
MNNQGTLKKAVFALATVTVLVIACASAGGSQAGRPAPISAQGKQCLQCHNNTTPGLVEQWKNSAHYRSGIDCYSCHKANDGDPATFDHYGNKIAVIVTPNYCNRCHKKEVTEFEASHHANAASFIGSLDNILGEVVEGGAAAVSSTCHMSATATQPVTHDIGSRISCCVDQTRELGEPSRCDAGSVLELSRSRVGRELLQAVRQHR